MQAMYGYYWNGNDLAVSCKVTDFSVLVAQQIGWFQLP